MELEYSLIGGEWKWSGGKWLDDPAKADDAARKIMDAWKRLQFRLRSGTTVIGFRYFDPDIIEILVTGQKCYIPINTVKPYGIYIIGDDETEKSGRAASPAPQKEPPKVVGDLIAARELADALDRVIGYTSDEKDAEHRVRLGSVQFSFIDPADEYKAFGPTDPSQVTAGYGWFVTPNDLVLAASDGNRMAVAGITSGQSAVTNPKQIIGWRDAMMIPAKELEALIPLLRKGKWAKIDNAVSGTEDKYIFAKGIWAPARQVRFIIDGTAHILPRVYAESFSWRSLFPYPADWWFRCDVTALSQLSKAFLDQWKAAKKTGKLKPREKLPAAHVTVEGNQLVMVQDGAFLADHNDQHDLTGTWNGRIVTQGLDTPAGKHTSSIKFYANASYLHEAVKNYKGDVMVSGKAADLAVVGQGRYVVHPLEFSERWKPSKRLVMPMYPPRL